MNYHGQLSWRDEEGGDILFRGEREVHPGETYLFRYPAEYQAVVDDAVDTDKMVDVVGSIGWLGNERALLADTVRVSV